MAVKKTDVTADKAEAKTKAEQKTTELKKTENTELATVPKKVEPTKEEAKKAEPKKTEPKKAAAKKAEPKKAATKKAAAKTKAAAKKEMKVSAILEYQGRQIEEKTMIAAVKDVWTKAGNKVGDIKKLELYIKPEENSVYYVINGIDTGQVVL
ncbi:MAG: DUF6465 family protein [Lachnospiraceae bacterium]